MRIAVFSFLCLGGLLSASPFVQAQATPDAGSLRQQIEQPRAQPLPQAVPQPKVTPLAELQPAAGMAVRVQSFLFSGNTLLATERLSAAVADFTDRELDFAGLQRAADAVAAAYREAGWMARVYLPEQDVSAGVITLQVEEARFGGVRLEGAPSQRVMASELQAWFNTHQTAGQPLNAKALDRALLLADDLPGVSVVGTLASGTSDGDIALVLQTTNEPFAYGDVGLDNTGARSTGSQRVTANLNINSPGGRGELLSMNLLHTQGSEYGRVALTVPDGHNGLRLGVNASSMTYKVIDGPGANSAAQIEGRSSSMGIDWSSPLVRERLLNLYFSGGLDNKHFYTQDSQVRSDYETDSLRVGLSGNQFDELGGGGANSASLQMLWGRLSNVLAHNQIDTIARQYHKLNYSVSRQQAINAEHSLLLGLQGQHATQVLDSSEKFYIGGAQTVRAYPLSELGGERGQVLTGEWRWRLAPTWLLTAFADWGRVVAFPTTSSEQQTAMVLRGQGLSLGWQGPAGLAAKLTWSRRSGSNPKPTSTGTDGDGTLQLDRLWWSASVPF